MTSQAMSGERVDEWVAFSERWPPKSAALDDPSVMTTDRVLVTNNIDARDRMGRMSHVWWATPIQSKNEIVAFTENDWKIYGLTHWLNPFASRIHPDGQGSTSV